MFTFFKNPLADSSTHFPKIPPSTPSLILSLHQKKSQHPKSSAKSPSNPSPTIQSLYRTRYRKSSVKLHKIRPLSNHFQTIFFTLPILLPSKHIEISHILPMHHPDHKKYKNIKPSPLPFLTKSE